MIIIFSIVLIALISIALAAWSLRSELRKTEPEKSVKEDLSKGRVIFYSPSEKTTPESH